MTEQARYYRYLSTLSRPFRKLSKLEFLQPDGSVAFALSNNYMPGYMNPYDSRAFLQIGTLNVALQNGIRRQADITLSDVDDNFAYAVNKLWFGQRLRLSMGLQLPDGTDFYLPQGVFYLQSPKTSWTPNNRTISYNLVDKWAYLDGSLFGNLDGTYQVNRGTDMFDAIRSILRLSRFDYTDNAADEMCIDPVTPVFTTYYNGKVYYSNDSDTGLRASSIPKTEVPYTMTTEAGGSFADVLLELNNTIAGLIGYDPTGALRIEPSQDDVDDSDKPVLWEFTPSNSSFCSLEETVKNAEVYNDVLIVGEGLSGSSVWGRATNVDPKSDTNVNIIGSKLYREEKAEYWNTVQCSDLAQWMLKRKTILQKEIAITSSQMFHLAENRLVSVRRTDKEGSPVEKHIIQSYSLPIGEKGEMSINAVSANDIPEFKITSGKGGR